MFARNCSARMGTRFASGNVFYMNRTFSARHMNSVASPLGCGFVTPVRLFSSSQLTAATYGIQAFGGNSLVDGVNLLDEPVGSSRRARNEVMKILTGFDMVPMSVLKDCFVCASQDFPDHLRC